MRLRQGSVEFQDSDSGWDKIRDDISMCEINLEVQSPDIIIAPSTIESGNQCGQNVAQEQQRDKVGIRR